MPSVYATETYIDYINALYSGKKERIEKYQEFLCTH